MILTHCNFDKKVSNSHTLRKIHDSWIVSLTLSFEVLCNSIVDIVV